MGENASANKLKVIIDSNVFIDIEDHGHKSSDHTRNAAELSQLASRVNASLLIAAGTKDDLMRGAPSQRTIRLAQLAKYQLLGSVFVRPDLALTAGFPTNRSRNDQSDLDILAALDVGAADWLVTNDEKLRRRAARAGLEASVFSVPDAIETLRQFLRQAPSIPDVQLIPGYQINLHAPIFSELKSDYPEFPDWWRDKVVRGERDVLILGDKLSPEGLAVLKIETESDHNHDLLGKVLKISTFKVAEPYAGSRRGELLLRASIEYARKNECQQVYLEVLPKRSFLVEWLGAFGFANMEGTSTSRGELVVCKELIPVANSDDLNALKFNITYGPGAIQVKNPLVVPIRRSLRAKLLPQPESQLALFSMSEACGNAIRKAYLSNAPLRRISEGDSLLFYESQGKSAIVAVGVVESVRASGNAEDILRFVGNRTVYSPQEVALMCRSKNVLAIRFRFDRTLDEPWSLQTMFERGLVKRAPQSIQRINKEGLEWVRTTLAK